jgi:hypothetical protein
LHPPLHIGHPQNYAHTVSQGKIFKNKFFLNIEEKKIFKIFYISSFESDINGFTPYGARALSESAVRDQFYNSGGGIFGIFLLVLPKMTGKSMLTEEMMEEVMKVSSTGKNYIT